MADAMNMRAEQSVLGGLMLDNDLIDEAATILKLGDFYRSDHRTIFKAIFSLNEKGMSADPVTVTGWLEDHQLLEQAGGQVYIGQITHDTPAAKNTLAYAEQVAEKAAVRRLSKLANMVSELAHGPGDAAGKYADAEELFYKAISASAFGRSKTESIHSLMPALVEEIENRSQRQGLTGLSTGYADVDRITAGLNPGDLIILAARPSMGKTTLAMNLGEHAATRGAPVAVFSLEMQAKALGERMLSSAARVSSQRLRSGQLTEDEFPKITDALGKVSKWPLYIDDSADLNVRDIRARAFQLKRQYGIQLIVIDYLQLISGDNPDNRTLEVTKISRGLKSLAKDLNVPVIALSQLNRELEKRNDKRPKLSDLRDSGSIEQDADLILFLYRDEIYHENTPEKGIAELIIGKQRNGPIGTIRLTYLPEFFRFENFSGCQPASITKSRKSNWNSGAERAAGE